MKDDTTVAIIGLGYVGLTLAVTMADVGFTIVGIERRQDVVDMTNNATPYFAEKGLQQSLKRVIDNKKLVAYSSCNDVDPCDVYIITVGTPLHAHTRIASLDAIKRATKQVAHHMKNGSMVILRSTVKVATTRNIVKPILEKSGKTFDIAMCPERTLEGNALKELRTLPQIVGADTLSTRNRASQIFKELTNSVIDVSSLESAELVKLIDNTYRDVQFGFANEVARACACFKVSAYEVIQAGKLGYERTNVALPGLVGGPCLEKDPHILDQSVQDCNISLDIVKAARYTNENQPKETVRFIKEELIKRGIFEKVNIAILGMAFKGIPETDDLRGSMSIVVLNEIRDQLSQADIFLYDPIIDSKVLQKKFLDCQIEDNIADACYNKHVIIIANNHPSLGDINIKNMLAKMKKNGFIYDYWNHYSALDKSQTNHAYYAVGNIE